MYCQGFVIQTGGDESDGWNLEMFFEEVESRFGV